MAGYTRQSSTDIVPTATVRAAPINAEYNALRDAFEASAGHRHDGSTGEGGYIPLIADIDANNKVVVDTANNRVSIYTEVSGAPVEQIRVQDGAIVPVTDNDVDLGAAGAEFKDLYIDGTANIDNLVAAAVAITGGTIDGTVVGGTTPAAITGTTITADTGFVGDLTGDVTGDVTGDLTGNVTGNVTGDVTGDLTGNVTSTGASSFASVDIDGGNIDGTQVGTATPTTVKGTVVTATTNFVGDVTGDVTGSVTGNITGNVTGDLTGDVTGDITGDVTSTGTSTFNDVTISGSLNMDAGTSSTITNLSTPVANKDAAPKDYVDTRVLKAGDTMSGNLDMDGNKVVGLAAPTANGEATRKEYVDAADDLKLNLTGGTLSGELAMGNNKVTGLADPTATTDAVNKDYVDTADALKVDKAGDTMSGALDMGTNKLTNVGTPTNTGDAANKGYVDTQVSNLVDAAPGALDTLNELAAAIGDDENFATTVTDSIATKLPLAGGTMTGDIAMGTSKVTGLGDPTLDKDAVNKEYVDDADALKLDLAGGTMSGDLTLGANKATSTATPATDDALTRKGYVDDQDDLKLDLAGGTMTGNITMGANAVTSTATPATADTLTRKGYVDNQDALKLDLTGGTLTGDLDMGANAVTSSANPTTDSELSRKGYVDSEVATKLNLSGGTLTGNLVMGGNKVTSTATPSVDDDLTRKGYVDNILGSATASAVSAAAALASENAASLSESNAADSESNASTSEDNASDSADDAEKLAINPEDSQFTLSDGTTQGYSALHYAAKAEDSATAASTSESNASDSETAAGNSETAAAGSATAAATSASGASTSETNAAASASTAVSAKDDAETAQAAAEAALDELTDLYLGAKASDPAVDNDGNALQEGALYYDTASDVMKVYEGSTWVAAYASLSGTLTAANNLGDLENAATGRTNLGLGTIATQDAGNVNIDGGAIDGTAIGANSASTGAFTSVTANTADIDGGTVDGVTIGGSTAGVGTFTDVTADSVTATTADIDGGSIDGAAIGANSASTGAFTSLTANTADINAGTVDGVTIGGSSAGAGTFTSVTATTADINGGTVDGVTIGGSSAGAGTFTSVTATTADINGGSIDGATIGANSASTGKFTTAEVANYIDLKTTSSPSWAEGRIFYDATNDTLAVYNSESDITLQVGQEEYIRVYNDTASTITNGTPVYLTGESGTVPTIAPASATSEDMAEAVGLATHSIEASSYGFVTVRGLVGDLDTSALTVGERVHLSATTGELQETSPTYPYFSTDMGVCLISSATVGCIYVQPVAHFAETYRVTSDLRVDGDTTIAGDLTVLGTQTIASSNNVSIGSAWNYFNSGDTIGDANTTFTGSGLDDGVLVGHYEGTASTTSFYVEIDGTGTPDTFKWSYNSDLSSPEATGVSITGEPQELSDGISIEFNATTGHTSGDKWSGTATPTNVDTGFATNRNTGTSGVGYTHAGFYFDVSDEKWKVFSEYDPEPEGNINTADASFTAGTLVADTFEGDLDGNANTASSLETARTIAGQSFDGTANISIAPTDLTGVTATAAELNKLDGATVTTAEINKLDGFTGVTADLNYAKDLRATGVTTTEFNKLDGLTATTGELNILDGVTATTAEINKLDGFTGAVADLNYAKDLRATGVTTAEFDRLDGLTASTAELNKLDGVTATTAELNKVDGLTASTAELNYVDGVTSNIQTQLNAKADDSTTITAGTGLTGGGSLGANRTINLANTAVSAGSYGSSSQIPSITVDAQGRVTAASNNSISVGNGTVTVNGGSGLTGSGAFSMNQTNSETVTLSHADTSSQASVNNSGRTVIQDITLDGFGHITGIGSTTISDSDTTYSAGNGIGLSGTTFSVAAGAGLVQETNGLKVGDNGIGSTQLNVSGTGNTSQYLRSDGDGTFTWATPPNTTYSVGDGGLTQKNFTTTLKNKLDGIAAGATNVTNNNQLTNGAGYITSYVNTTYSADGNYGMTLSGTTFRLENDRRRNATGEDVWSGNTHDYTWYDALVGIRWYTAGAEEMRLENDGDLHVDGNITAYSTTVSDPRLKENVEKVTGGLDKVAQLTGYTFDYIHDGRKSAGVMSTDIEKVLPSAIQPTTLGMQTGDEETVYNTVQYDQLSALFIEAIKELKVEVDDLKAKLKDAK